MATNFQNGIKIAGVEITSTAAELNILDGVTADKDEINLLDGKTTIFNNLFGITAATKTGATGQKACLINGVTVITGGTGIADMTLAAPTAGAVAIIRIGSLTSGSVVVTCAAGVTLNGTNNVATFDAAEEALMLVYKAANTWEVALNVGGVALSTAT